MNLFNEYEPGSLMILESWVGNGEHCMACDLVLCQRLCAHVL